MSENITVIDYEETKLYTLINKKGRKITNSYEQSAYIDNDDWECFQDFGIQYINDAVYNDMDCKEVKDISSGFHFFIYNEFIRKVDDYRIGDYIRIVDFDTIREMKKDDFTISPYFWKILYKKPLKVYDILDDRNSVLVKYMYEENYVSIIPKEAIRYVCTAQEVDIFIKTFDGHEIISTESKIDKELAKISAITDTIEDGEKTYIDTDSVLSKNPSDKNTKLALFFNYILRYNNTENIDDFLKRFEKS